MAVRKMSGKWLSEVGDENEDENEPMNAFVYRAKIIEVGRLCRSIGDQLSESNVELHQNENLGWLTELVNVIDVTLDWLEHEIPNVNINSKKIEHILRGLYNVTELGNNAQIFPILKIACEFLNNEKDPFKEERQRILNCLEQVEKRQATLESLIKDASRLLEEMLDSDKFDYAKQREFDNVVRKANVEIDFCSRRLNGAEKAINKLSEKWNIIKWVSRGCCITFYVLYKQYEKSGKSSWDLLKFGGLALFAGSQWIGFIPGKAGVMKESLSKLKADHLSLKENLEDLRTELSSIAGFRDGLFDLD
ncbi:uncharacterized protein LOC124435049 isoform X2 [Xenia sp. Carnegie-2017]|uniref:uncharacterized protein LOC124435049 isoform X2 n=1 Tax=Xenia sp. Carnegie-2017 TaxID=2897299 RepID=UPI001F040ACD|nr:uncharacterized protein LOC124435049 isoform X2 [Xenia sp. Carnegie-2017]